MGRVRVKICGITIREDALLAAELGADALGFIFAPSSPRYLSPEAARAIVDTLPPFVTPVAVMVNEPLARVEEILTLSGCRVAQLHGDTPTDLLAALAWPVVQAVSVAVAEDLAPLSRYPHARAFLLDTKVAGQHGGTGQTFDWTLARQARGAGKPIILAGGLNPDNIADAIAVAQPDAVDLSSGVEREPGKKDHARLRALFVALTTPPATPTSSSAR